jgi:Icc-related predicted phosphoesterase
MTQMKLLTATDLHQHRWLYEGLEKAVEEHKPDVLALVGDFLDAGELTADHCQPEECAERLAALPCETVFTIGNHDADGWEPFAERWLKLGRSLFAPHGEAVVFGPLVLVAFPCSFGNDRFFLMGRPHKSMDVDRWLPKIVEQYGRAARTCWLMHEPPARTKLCPADGFLAGLDEWREAVKHYQPWLTIHGHNHITPLVNKCWHDKINQTNCINVGQPHQTMRSPKPLHYCVLDFGFPGSEPSLPAKVEVSAYPWNKRFDIPK